MIIALAGRRIDDPKQEIPRFPLSLRWVVRSRIQAFLRNKEVTAVVCSGANGADLLALEVAGNLGLRRVMILPGEKNAFKEKYVTDRPGNWGKTFDKIYDELSANGDVQVVAGGDEGIEVAHARCLVVAEEIAKGDKVGTAIFWEEGTEPFAKVMRDGAKTKGYWVTDISTREWPGDKALLVLNQGGKGLTVGVARDLNRELTILKEFNYSRRIFGLIRKEDTLSVPDRIEMDQKYALSVYKDVDLPVDLRLEEALRVLKQICMGQTVPLDQETLSLTGAVYKRKWEVDGQEINLEQSFKFYHEAYKMGPATDDGYSGINAAFILDLLAQNEMTVENKIKAKEELSEIQKKNIAEYELQAAAIRERVISILQEPSADADAERKYWIYVTIAEANFGLGKYEEARVWLVKAMAAGSIPDWMLESTTRQLAQISLLRPQKKSDTVWSDDAWSVLSVLTSGGDSNAEMDDSNGALRTAFLGKAGLALSGGGFRAALYHIGVLARLAELDMLRNIEVLSCVSGGSIIGAHYYLELKHLLETNEDHAITREHYIKIVEKISRDFLKGVQRNLRMRVVSNWWDNFRMFWDPQYSRSLRLGQLYERDIFSRATDVKYDEHGRIMLNRLFIYPLQKEGKLEYKQTWFNPKYDNWRRRNKAPILLLNATTLNTGHNWQFSASWMGESPFTVQKIDGNDRLRRMYYKDGPDVKKPFRREIRLGHAVAASSAVPGLFDPLRLDKLYPEYKVSLVDGGVHDNQGVAGLLEQDCTVMLVSDASGQMTSELAVPDNPLSVPLRANDILMERVRNAEYQDLATRKKTSLLKGFFFIHLKLELDIKTVNWRYCEDPQETETLDRPEILITTYDMRKDIQRLLSNIRTDLDSFNDTESYALMLSGYRMTTMEYPKTIKGFDMGQAPEHNWDFLVMGNELQDIDAPERTLQLLAAASAMVFKIWKLNPFLKWTARVLLTVAVLVVAALFYKYWKWEYYPIKVSLVGTSLGVFLLGMFVSKWVIDVLRWRDTIMRMLVIIGLVSVLWVVVWLHLWLFDPWYLKMGKRKIQIIKI